MSWGALLQSCEWLNLFRRNEGHTISRSGRLRMSQPGLRQLLHPITEGRGQERVVVQNQAPSRRTSAQGGPAPFSDLT